MGNYLSPPPPLPPPPPTPTCVYVGIMMAVILLLTITIAVGWLISEQRRTTRIILQLLEKISTSAGELDECQPGEKRKENGGVDESCVGAIVEEVTDIKQGLKDLCAKVEIPIEQLACIEEFLDKLGITLRSAEHCRRLSHEVIVEALRKAAAKCEQAIEASNRTVGILLLQVTNQLHEEVTDIKQGLKYLCAKVEIPMEQLACIEKFLDKQAIILRSAENCRRLSHEVIVEALRKAAAKCEQAIEASNRTVGILLLQVTNQLHEEVTHIKQGLKYLCAKVEIPMEQLACIEKFLDKQAIILRSAENCRRLSHEVIVEALRKAAAKCEQAIEASNRTVGILLLQVTNQLHEEVTDIIQRLEDLKDQQAYIARAMDESLEALRTMGGLGRSADEAHVSMACFIF